MFRATQVQQSRRFSRLAAKISADLPRRSQLVYSRPLTSTSAKPITKHVDNDAFAFILTRLEMVRKQAVRNTAAFERKQAAAKVVSSTPIGIAPTSDVTTLYTPSIDQTSIGAHSRSKDVRRNALGTTEAVPTALKTSAIAKSKPNSTPSLLQGQAFDAKLNSQVSGLARYARGSVYVGDWLDGKMHGQGKLTCPDGSSYEGMWQHDIRSGTGTSTFCCATPPASPVATIRSTTESGNISATDAVATKFTSYTGDWSNDTLHGTGCYTYPDGSTLSGEFVDGKLCNGHGSVRYTSSGSANTNEASIYVGDIVDYKRHGQGTLTKADRTQYVGHWTNNRRSGQGILVYPCSRRMEGNFKSGVLDGRGKITQSDPALYDYEGCFVQGVPQGDGVQTQRSTGNVYDGNFISGKRHGQGKFTYGDVNSHVVSLEGTWKENKLVGQGKQVNRDGSIIQGNFKYNKVQGELIYPDGEKFVGLIATVPPYADTGRGTVRTNNTLYKGELVGGKKQGRGVYTFVTPSENPLEDAKTQTYTGMFVDNKMHGHGVITCSEGTASGEFKDGLLYTGSGKMYVGNKLQWGRWVDGVRQIFAPASVNTNDSNGDTNMTVTDAEAASTSPTVVETTNSKNTLQGYYTLQVTPSATITGHFVDNYLVGQGVYSHIRNGRKVIYKGPFLKNKPHGSGVTTNKDGVWQSTYEYGTQKYGTFTSHEGTHKYVGETEGFTFNGKGKFEYPGYTYDGDFKMGVRHGYGVFTKHDVFFYAGYWVDNKRQGYGVNVNKQHTYKGMHYNDLQHGEGELIYNNGYTYKGTFFEGYMTSGVVKTTWGDSHYGEFTRGVRNGKGVFTFSDGVSVSGTWVDGKLHGFATISSPSVTSHSGMENATTNDTTTTSTSTSFPTAAVLSTRGYFENNVLQYQVTDDNTVNGNSAHKLWDPLPVLNNDSMFAPMRDFLSVGTTDNLKHGSGQILFSDGRVYVGVLKDGRMDGTGVLYSGPTGGKTASFGKHTVQGVFRDNKLYNCSGVLMDRGTLFECTWVNGVRQGYAKITQPSQRVLEGEYINDKFSIAKKNKQNSEKTIKPVESENTHDLPLTRDTVRLEEGRIYSGELNAGVPHGAGKISNSKGEVWEGEFAHGQLVKGFYSVHNGSEKASRSKSEGRKIGANKLTLVYKGEFVDFQYHGQGKLMLNGSVYEGGFENGLPHGYGKCVDSDFIYEGEYARGKRHGVGFITLPSGEVQEAVWFNDMFQETAIRPFNEGRSYPG